MTDIFDPRSAVYAEANGSIGRIVLNRPEKKNAMSQAMWTRVSKAVSALDAAPGVRVIVLCSSTPQSFSAGADISELEVIATDPERREANRLAIRTAQRDLARAKKPTIAQISGSCIGGGCGLAIHCDFRIASNKARFGITPAKLGIIYPLNDTKQLMDLIGVSAAKSMLFTGGLLGADEALEIGLIERLTETEALDETVTEFAQELAAVSQYSLNGMKQNIQRILDGQVDDDAQSEKMFIDAHEGEDAVEGVEAFLAKRPAKFTWFHDSDE